VFDGFEVPGMDTLVREDFIFDGDACVGDDVVDGVGG
jgi:hypothetical protein